MTSAFQKAARPSPSQYLKDYVIIHSVWKNNLFTIICLKDGVIHYVWKHDFFSSWNIVLDQNISRYKEKKKNLFWSKKQEPKIEYGQTLTFFELLRQFRYLSLKGEKRAFALKKIKHVD